MFGLETSLFILLIISVICVCAFEFINGFHDTANAVATVIYTNTLPPRVAVVLSAILNFVGVHFGGISVAIGIINLLPVESLISQDVWDSMAMVLALLLTAIVWNLGTWYLGIPCSSSHTLIGSILGVGIAFAFLPGNSGTSVNWGKASEVGVSLLLSPLLGMSLAALLIYILRKTVKNKVIFEAPKYKQAPPTWIRALLILTCSGVSFSHGSNDGQKGVGLMMLVLIGILPFYYALDGTKNLSDYSSKADTLQMQMRSIRMEALSVRDREVLLDYQQKAQELSRLLASPKDSLADKKAFEIRKDILVIDRGLKKILEAHPEVIASNDREALKKTTKSLKELTDYAPSWVILAISLSLGIGTMIGWKRIVVTIGEKIGKEHLSYAQGASAELVAASTIGFSSVLGLPVSTTHILSSGVAGTMIATNGVKNLQPATIRSIAIAWILTLPVCIVTSGGLFLLFRLIL